MKYLVQSLLMLVLTLSLQAMAAGNLAGQYEGRIKEVNGYPGSAGEACTVTIGTAPDFGGSTTFSINGVKPILFENRHIDKQIELGKKRFKLVTGGSYSDTEIVVVQLGDDGAPIYLKMARVDPKFHAGKNIDCDGMVKK